MARANKYGIIKRNFPKIEKLLQQGATEKQVAKTIGIGYSTWNKYKAEKEEFSELIIKSREKPVDELINAMYKSGLGFKTTIRRQMKLKQEYIDPITDRKLTKDVLTPYEEEIYIPPNFQAAKFLIMNWGKDRGYCSEPKMLEMREKELQYKIEQDQKDDW